MASPGDSAHGSFTVTEDDTASALGSGDLPVLATPRLLAWCEAVTCRAIQDSLVVGSTSVGTRISLEHLVASSVGAQVAVTASVAHVDGRSVRFEVRATDELGRLVATGEVTRAMVTTDRFLERIRESAQG
ncbi:MAG: thioesterase [Actinomycetota bacterium]|nr:thioesterase [Actinomycetota bacterium]